MWKRVLVAGVFVLIVAALGAVILIQRLKKDESVTMLQAVPADAILFADNIEVDHLTEIFIPGGRIWIDFVNTAGFNQLDSIVNQTINWARSSEAFRNIMQDGRVSLSLHLIGKEQVTPLFYIHYSEMFSDNDFEQVVLEMLDEQTIAQDRKYEAETVFDVSSSPGSVPSRFSFACANGICLISSSAILVEEAVRTLQADHNYSTDNGLKQVKKTAGRFVHANIYINYSQFHQLFFPVVSHTHWKDISFLANLGSWGELDLDIHEDAIVLNGMTFVEPDDKLFLKSFEAQAPVKMELHQVLPSGIAGFLHFGISDREAFFRDVMAYFRTDESWTDVESEIRSLENRYEINPLTDMEEMLDDEMAWFTFESADNVPGNEIMMAEVRSPSAAEKILKGWLEGYLSEHTFDMRSLLHVYRLDDQTSFNIYQLPEIFFDGLPPGRLFNRHFTLYDRYLIFGPSVEALSQVIYQNVLHKTFVSDPVYKVMADYFSNRSNISLFIRPFPFMDYRGDLLDNELTEQLEKIELFLRRIPGLVIQFSSEGELYYQSVSFKYTSQIKEKAMTVWESMLDSTVMIKPELVVNHNTSEKEIFVQDASHKIYLINSTGRILWEQSLEGPILSEVYQIDFYNNGKFQYLFNTPGKLHLIDRNGNYVERYPILLRNRATNPMALFDYDNNREYRIFVAGEDREIYVYDIEGNVVTGWRFGKTESRVSRPVQHFRIGDKDYIVVCDDIRTYILNRRGRERVNLDKRLVVSPGNSFYLDMNIREEKPRWITTDTSGNVTGIYPDGTVSVLLEQDLSLGHYFTMQDMDMDGIPEYIVAEGDELRVLQQDGNRLFSFRVRESISSMPDIYKFSSSDVKVGITDQERERIYLINSDGSLYEGFPLEGSTRFSIGYFAGSDSRFNLIVGSSNNFLYNYSIE